MAFWAVVKQDWFRRDVDDQIALFKEYLFSLLSEEEQREYIRNKCGERMLQAKKLIMATSLVTAALSPYDV